MRDSLQKLSKHLQSATISWSQLYEAEFASSTKKLPIYVGIYRVHYKPGYGNAEKNYLKRLNDLVDYLVDLQLIYPQIEKYIDKIKAFHLSVNAIDFQSLEFKESSRIEFLKPLRQLIKQIETSVNELQGHPKHQQQLKKVGYQLNPFNYSYPYLSHLFYVTNEEIKTLLVDDSKRKSIRKLDDIFEFTTYLADLEAPRRKHKTALSFTYVLVEENPGFVKSSSTVFSGCNFDTSAGGGTKEKWSLSKRGVWKHEATFNHWRR